MQTQFEGPISGQIEVQVFESGGSAPSNIIRLDRDLLVKTILRLESSPETIRLEALPKKIGKLVAHFYLESLGPGGSYDLPALEQPWQTGKKIYEFQASLPSEHLGMGIFRVAAVITARDENGGSLPMTWYTDGVVLQTYA